MTNKEVVRFLIKHHNMKRLKYKGKLTPEQEKKYDDIMQGLQNIKKDLELLDKYKEIMCEPIKDLMKDLEILNIFKESYKSLSSNVLDCKVLVIDKEGTQKIDGWLNEK